MKFSVIIPVYNKADTIKSAVDSVLVQTVQDFEIVIVDDGSTDSPEKTVEGIPSVKLIRQDNGGVSVARNTGIAHASGEYLCFLDADDLWKPDHLETVSNLIEKYPGSDVFVTSHDIIMPDGDIIHSGRELEGYGEDFETDDFLGVLNTTSYSVVHTNSVCAHRDVFAKNNIRFEPGVKIGEDSDVWYRLGLKNKVAVSRHETTMYRREYSTATKVSSHIQNWIFSLRVQELLSDSDISEKAKASIIHLIDRYKLTSSREYMAANNRKEAKRVLSEVESKRGKRYLLTLIFTWLPYFVCRKVLGR